LILIILAEQGSPLDEEVAVAKLVRCDIGGQLSAHPLLHQNALQKPLLLHVQPTINQESSCFYISNQPSTNNRSSTNNQSSTNNHPITHQPSDYHQPTISQPPIKQPTVNNQSINQSIMLLHQQPTVNNE
jgi:hypothetical protein